jgi:hypothetical protein
VKPYIFSASGNASTHRHSSLLSYEYEELKRNVMRKGWSWADLKRRKSMHRVFASLSTMKSVESQVPEIIVGSLTQ